MTARGGALVKNYVVHFEIAAIAFLVLMIVLIKVKRQLKIVQTKLFFAELILILLLNVLDIVSALIINEGGTLLEQQIPIYVSYGITILTYLLQQVTVMLFMVYVMSFIDIRKLGKAVFGIFCALSVVYGILVVSTPFTHLVFSIDEKGHYQHGELHMIYLVVPVLCGGYTAILMFAKRRMMSVIQKRTLVFFLISTGFVIALQIVLFPQYLLVYFWMTIAFTAIFLTFQSPDYYLDQTTSAFNSDGFMIMLSDRMERRKPFSVLLMSVHDFEGIKDGFSMQNKRRVYSQICSTLLYGQGRKNKKQGTRQNLYLGPAKKQSLDVFRDDDKIYIMFYDVPTAEEKSIAIGTWVTEGIRLEGQEKPVKIVAKMLLFDFPGDIRSVEDFYSVIKYFHTDDYYNRYNVLNSINDEFFRKKKRYEDVRGLVEEAIRTEGVEMYYQPIYSTVKGDFHSAEALVRLRDVNSIGFVSPEEFIRIAEKEHLILQLEEIILRKICKFIRNAGLQELGVEYIEVNLSGNQCMQADLYVQLQDLIREFGISPQSINFEVTETSAISDSSCLSKNMEEMKRYGSTFALDDYGSGASNLQYLVDYPFDLVKLDKSIVWAHFRENNPKTRPVLPQTVRMLREMNVEIVAEGVEYEEEVRGLAGMGVQYLQGYYFSKPVCEADFLCFLRAHNRKM